MLIDRATYVGLFLSAFDLAALLPLQSETVLAALLLRGGQSVAWLPALAIVGNVLGSWVNWWLGRYLEHLHGRRWPPVDEMQLLRTQRHYRRYGRWTLLLSWVPTIDDPLTLMTGIVCEPCWSFLLIAGLAKTFRYLVLVALALGWAG